MSRIRITARNQRAADQTPYPGNVNQPDRKDPSWDQYHTFEQTVNHELPDMRHQWQDDSRDEIGFGIPEAWGKQPTVAEVKVASNKAVRVAILLLGDKVGDEVIEAQAADFLAMGPKAMDRTMTRFADTQKFYAEDDKVEEKDEEKKAADDKVEDKVEDKKVDEKTAASEAEFKTKIEKPGSPEQPKVADEKKDEKKDEKSCSAADEKVEDKKDEEKKAAMPEFIQKKIDEKKDEKKDDKKAADESDKDEDKIEDKKASKVAMGEFDIELTGAMDDEIAPDDEADERLASLFDNDGFAAGVTAGNSDRKVEASQKKAGITKLGGQPRVVTASGSGVDISDIWQSAPDVSAAFK